MHLRFFGTPIAHSPCMRITPAIVSMSVVLLAPWAFAQQGWFSPDAPAPSASESEAPSEAPAGSESAAAAPQAPVLPQFSLPTWLAPSASSLVIPMPPLPRGAKVHVSISVTLDPSTPAKPAPSAAPSCAPPEPPPPAAPHAQLVVKPYNPQDYPPDDEPHMRPKAPNPDDVAVPREGNNLLFFEVGGAGFLYSINYERFFSDNFSVRIGFEYFNGCCSQSTTIIPITANFYFPVSQNGRHNIELSAGISPYSGWNDNSGVYFTGSVGYRYIPRVHGVTTFIGFTPIWDPSGQMFGSGSINVLPWFGTSIGAAF